MFKKSLFALFLVFLTCAAIETAQADTPVVSCGVPDAAALETDPGGTFCDFYSRQLAYAPEAKKFRVLLKERQKNFGAINVKVERQYRKDMRAYHGYEEEPEEQPADESAESAEAFGPAINP